MIKTKDTIKYCERNNNEAICRISQQQYSREIFIQEILGNIRGRDRINFFDFININEEKSI